MIGHAQGSAVGPPDDAGPTFDDLMAEVMTTAERFGHRQHVHLTWLAVRAFGVPHATALVSDGIRRTARYAGAPQKYHETVSRAWVELVGHHAAEGSANGSADVTAEFGDFAEFAEFATHNPALLDKRLLSRFYRPSTLASPKSRTEWVEPDLAPFPWKVPGHVQLTDSGPRSHCEGTA
jgi:hypothetical protein